MTRDNSECPEQVDEVTISNSAYFPYYHRVKGGAVSSDDRGGSWNKDEDGPVGNPAFLG